MESILDMIDSQDVLPLLFLIALLCGIGGKMIEKQPQLGHWASRFAVLAFFSYCFYAGNELGSVDSVSWIGVLFRGLFAAGLTLGFSWIALSFLGYFKGITDGMACRASAQMLERKQKQEERNEAKARLCQEREWEEGAPERKRQQQEEAAKNRQEAHSQQVIQQQRDSIRYACELYYNLHAPQLAKRFSRKALNRFMETYMNDSQPVDLVEQRAAQLNKTIQQHIESVNPPEAILTIEGLVHWYTAQKQQIESLAIDGLYKDDYLRSLTQRYAELSNILMENLSP